MPNGSLIIGAGGHGKVIADALLRHGQPVMGFLDDDNSKIGYQVLGLNILGNTQAWRDLKPSGLVIGVGDNQVRKEIANRLNASQPPPSWLSVVHPNSTIASYVRLGYGTVIMAGAIVNSDTTLGDHVILNTGATVDHDCVIGDFVHIAPGANLAGQVHIGNGTFVGIGCSIIHNCKIGENTVIGAGAVVICDIPSNVIAVGVPARWK